MNPGLRLSNLEAWQRAVNVAFEAQKDWQLPIADRTEVVPGASHFAALDLAQPNLAPLPRGRDDRLAHLLRVDKLTAAALNSRNLPGKKKAARGRLSRLRAAGDQRLSIGT